MQNAFLVNEKDSVAIVNCPIRAGETVTYLAQDETVSLSALHDIPIYHKIAVKDIGKGESVIKYGEFIGIATQDIKAGEHVHTHNLTDIT